MKILRAWIAPFPTERGTPSGVSSIAFRVEKTLTNIQFPLRLETRESPAIRECNEMHYSLKLIDDDSLIILRDAINKYLESPDYLNKR